MNLHSHCHLDWNISIQNLLWLWIFKKGWFQDKTSFNQLVKKKINTKASKTGVNVCQKKIIYRLTVFRLLLICYSRIHMTPLYNIKKKSTWNIVVNYNLFKTQNNYLDKFNWSFMSPCNNGQPPFYIKIIESQRTLFILYFKISTIFVCLVKLFLCSEPVLSIKSLLMNIYGMFLCWAVTPLSQIIGGLSF